MDWTQHLSPKQPRKWLCVFLSMSSGRTETEEPISGSRSARRRLLPVNLSPCPSQRSICYISVSAACWYIVTLKPTWIFIVSHLSCVTVGPLVLVDKMGCRLIEKASFWVWSELCYELAVFLQLPMSRLRHILPKWILRCEHVCLCPSLERTFCLRAVWWSMYGACICVTDWVPMFTRWILRIISSESGVPVRPELILYLHFVK